MARCALSREAIGAVTASSSEAMYIVELAELLICRDRESREDNPAPKHVRSGFGDRGATTKHPANGAGAQFLAGPRSWHCFQA
jgi:hypothetical protein